VTTYAYDAANRRVKKTSGAATTIYVWDGDAVIAEYDQSGVLLVDNVYLGGRMLAAEAGGEVMF
jgi:hypothetical protein